MQHKLYLNGQYLKTVELAGFCSNFYRVFDCEKVFITIFFFYEDGILGAGGYYGIVDKKTEKRIRDNIKEKETVLATKIFAARNEGWCDGYDVGFDAAKKTALKKISEITFSDTGE